MAQETINIGTSELTGDGESIRSAFSKINSNFTELYANPSSGSNDVYLVDGGSATAVYTSSDLVLDGGNA